MEEKVYTTEVITETDFPTQGSVQSSAESTSESGTFTATKVNDKKITTKRVAAELLSTALNTRSKRILQEFQLEQSGGFKIGNFKDGVTGEVSITPNGVEAKDVAGITTFALDGTDGSAVFKGSVQAGSIITGLLYLGSIGGNITIDGENQTITVNDGITDRILIGFQENGF